MDFRRTFKNISGLLMVAVLAGSAWASAAEISSADIEAHVTAHVRESLKTLMPGENPSHIQVSVIKVPGAPFQFGNAKTPESVSVTTDSSLPTRYSERTIVRVKMMDPAGKTRELGVPVRIQVTKPVWVVKNAIQANEPLRSSGLALETREVSHFYSHTLGKEKDLKGYVARVGLRPGDILDPRKIVLPPDVSCNDEVRIVLSLGHGMKITVPGIAMANGRIGETIRVRQSVYQRKYYSAKVIDKNRVLVEI